MINYSIIIPHFNIPDLLARCLRSIPERDDVQVIVVDDNSPGNGEFLATIPELSRTNVEFYVTTDGLGAGHARNIGLSHAKGKWLIFADSDDYFVDNFNSFLDEYVNDSHEIIYFNVSCCDCYDNTRIYNEDKLKIYKETGDELSLRICYTEPWGKFIQRQVVTDNGLSFQETKAHNDLLFAVKVGLTAESLLAVDRPLYWYVIREGSTGHQKGPEPFDKVCDRVVAWNSTDSFLNQHGIKTKIFLPIIPCIKILKKDVKFYFRLICFMKDNDINYKHALIDTLKYFVMKLFCFHNTMTFYGMISKSSIVEYDNEKKVR